LFAKLHKRYHVDLTLEAAEGALPRKPFEEKLTLKASTRNNPCHGQFGVLPHPHGASAPGCRLRIRGRTFFGGAIPHNWIPSVEKRAIRGYRRPRLLRGISVGIFRATVYDGKYPMWIASDRLQKLPVALPFKECMKQARPVLLEPA